MTFGKRFALSLPIVAVVFGLIALSGNKQPSTPVAKWESITGVQQGIRLVFDVDIKSIQKTEDGASASATIRFSQNDIQRVTYICRAPSSGLQGAVIFQGRVVDIAPGSTSDGVMRRICFGPQSQSAHEAQKLSALPSSSDAQLLAEEDDLNDKCRGGSGDEASTQTACNEREKRVSELNQRGWCYGEPNQAMYQMSWHRCAATSVSEVKKSGLEIFQENNTKAMQNMALAHAAAQCGLRSDAWLETFNTAYVMASDTDIKHFHLTDAQIAEANVEGQKTYADTISHTRCSELLNSPTMERLDRLHDKLTGGYR